MNDSRTTMNTAPAASWASRVAVVDDAGMVWAHANPAELYRWIAGRNDLLGTIAVAFRQGAGSSPPASPAIGSTRRGPAVRRGPASRRISLI